MNTLVVYDMTGYIIFQGCGDYREPIGIPFFWAEIPEGKRIVRIDVSGDTHVPIFEDLPKSEIQLLREENLEIACSC